jgi:hypothetical protein
MSGTIPQLPLHVLMTWTGPTLCFISCSPASCEGTWGIGGIYLPILNLGVDGVNGQRHAVATLQPDKKPPFSFGNRTVTAADPFWIFWSGQQILASARNLTILGTSVS